MGSTKNITKPSDLNPEFIKRIEKKYGPMDMENDFFSSDLTRYFKTKGVDKVRGSINHELIELASFNDSYKKLVKAIKALKLLYRKEEVKDDDEMQKIFSNLKNVFNMYRTHLRKNYPDQYSQIKTTLEEMSTAGTGMQYATPKAFKEREGYKKPIRIYESKSNPNNKLKIIIQKDKKHPNFLHVKIKYEVWGGFQVGLSSQKNEENEARGLEIAGKVENLLNQKYNIEDIEVSSKKTGIIRVFAVSDDFVDADITSIRQTLTPATSINEETVNWPGEFRYGGKRYVFFKQKDGRVTYEHEKYKGDKITFTSKKEMEDYLGDYTEPKGGTQSSQFESKGANLGPGPKACSKGVTNNSYVSNYQYKLVPDKIKGSGLEVNQLFEAGQSTEEFQQERIEAFDTIEEELNDVYKMLSNAKNETAQFYSDNPGSYEAFKPTDLVLEYIEDIKKLLGEE